MTYVFLVRHGETDFNKTRLIQGGASDTPLNGTGELQAQALAARLSKEPLRAIYCSPLQRAVHTARAIAARHHLEVNIEPCFRELNVGGLEGIAVSAIAAQVNKLMGTDRPPGATLTHSSQDAFANLPYIGGESTADLQQRAWNGLKNIVVRHPDETIAVVTHQFVILSIICATLGLPAKQINRFRLGVASLSAVVIDARGPRLALFNETYYL